MDARTSMRTRGSTPSSRAKSVAARHTVVSSGATSSAGEWRTSSVGASVTSMVSKRATGTITESTRW